MAAKIKKVNKENAKDLETKKKLEETYYNKLSYINKYLGGVKTKKKIGELSSSKQKINVQ